MWTNVDKAKKGSLAGALDFGTPAGIRTRDLRIRSLNITPFNIIETDCISTIKTILIK